MQVFEQKSDDFLLFYGNISMSKIFLPSFFAVYIHKKRRPRAVYLQSEAFALPSKSNKQQETYADMTTLLLHIWQGEVCSHTHRHLLLTLV